MKNLCLLIVVILILTACNSSNTGELENLVQTAEGTISEKENEISRLLEDISKLEMEVESLKNDKLLINEELELNIADKEDLKEEIENLSEDVFIANRVIDTLEMDMGMAFEDSLIIDLSFNENDTIAVMSIYDSGPYTGVYLYERNGLELTKVEEIVGAYCDWGPYNNLIVCSEGTYIEQSGWIYSAVDKDVITEFSHIGTVSWLNPEEIIYEQYNYEIFIDNGTEFPHPIDVIKKDIYTEEVEYLLVGTKDYSFIINDNDNDISFKKIYEDDSKESEVVLLEDI